MQNSGIAGVIAAGCGFLLLVNTALILLILYIVIASQSPAGRQSLESLFASLVQITGLEQDTTRPVEATVAALATDVHELVLRPDSSSSVQVEDDRPTPTATASATSWPTVTTKPTNTPRPTPTPRPSPTPGPTSTPMPTATRRPTSTPRPTVTTTAPAVSDPPAEDVGQATARYYVIAPYRANARSCPRTSCPVITSFPLGTAVDVLQRVDGESVNGDTTWLELKQDSQVVYVHGSLLSQDRPQAAAARVARLVSQP